MYDIISLQIYWQIEEIYISCATNANREVDWPNRTPSVKGVGSPRMEQNINEILPMIFSI